jgi:hypothetical protein
VRGPGVAPGDVDADDRGGRIVGASDERGQRDEREQECGVLQRSSFDIQIESSIW